MDLILFVPVYQLHKYHHAWQIAISESQRQAIYADPKYLSGKYSKNDPPHGGLAVARQIAMISYRTHAAYEKNLVENG